MADLKDALNFDAPHTTVPGGFNVIQKTPPALTVKHTGVTEPTPRYEDLKAQLEYAEEIIRRLYKALRHRQMDKFTDELRLDDLKFPERLTVEITALYFAGAKTPAEFVKAEAGEKP